MVSADVCITSINGSTGRNCVIGRCEEILYWCIYWLHFGTNAVLPVHK